MTRTAYYHAAQTYRNWSLAQGVYLAQRYLLWYYVRAPLFHIPLRPGRTLFDQRYEIVDRIVCHRATCLVLDRLQRGEAWSTPRSDRSDYDGTIPRPHTHF
jgi:hypothetical protein